MQVGAEEAGTRHARARRSGEQRGEGLAGRGRSPRPCWEVPSGAWLREGGPVGLGSGQLVMSAEELGLVLGEVG